jgi:hypothetical protein
MEKNLQRIQNVPLVKLFAVAENPALLFFATMAGLTRLMYVAGGTAGGVARPLF